MKDLSFLWDVHRRLGLEMGWLYPQGGMDSEIGDGLALYLQ